MTKHAKPVTLTCAEGLTDDDFVDLVVRWRVAETEFNEALRGPDKPEKVERRLSNRCERQQNAVVSEMKQTAPTTPAGAVAALDLVLERLRETSIRDGSCPDGKVIFAALHAVRRMMPALESVARPDASPAIADLAAQIGALDAQHSAADAAAIAAADVGTRARCRAEMDRLCGAIHTLHDEAAFAGAVAGARDALAALTLAWADLQDNYLENPDTDRALALLGRVGVWLEAVAGPHKTMLGDWCGGADVFSDLAETVPVWRRAGLSWSAVHDVYHEERARATVGR